MTVAETYTRLASKRDPYLRRARAASRLTIPTLFPEEGQDGNDYDIPYQGTGARGVKSLASKILMALFPPNTPFFMMTIDEAVIGQELPDATKGDIEAGLRIIEKMVASRVDQKSMRTEFFEALKQLLVGGNVLLHLGKTKLRAFRLDNYVVKRNGEGVLTKLIVREVVDKAALPDTIQSLIADSEEDGLEPSECYVYTIVERQPNGRYKVHQEACDTVIPETTSSYQEDSLPWIPLRMITVDGEDYGRSYVEEHMGDLSMLENLSKALLEGSMAAARILFLVKPNSATKIKSLRDAANGDFISGNREDVTALQLEKFADFRVAAEQINKLEIALAQSFMMTQSVQRNAERVTAEEIRALTTELEATLGGVYSLLAQELQLPLIRLIISRLEADGLMQKLPKGIKPKILTGVEAMGRASELQKLSAFLNYLSPLGQEAIAEYLQVDEYIKRLANATNLETKGLIRSPEERQQAAEQQAAMRVAENAVPQMVKK